jgi:predicted 3-demethylubiquinone-9 3-methyltransferase (glyoxalase superfamily)
MPLAQKITPYLWFDHQALEAAEFYVSLFNDSKIVSVSHYGEAGPAPAGSVMSVVFQLEGQQFMALNGGPRFPFTDAISFFVDCADQAEVDALWDKLVAGGNGTACGWLKDRYGLSWQIIPRTLMDMLDDHDPARVRRVTEAMLKMVKIDVAELQRAYDSR